MLVSHNFEYSMSDASVSPTKLILWIAMINLVFSYHKLPFCNVSFCMMQMNIQILYENYIAKIRIILLI